MAAKNEDEIQRAVRLVRDRSLRLHGAHSIQHRAILWALRSVRTEVRSQEDASV